MRVGAAGWGAALDNWGQVSSSSVDTLVNLSTQMLPRVCCRGPRGSEKKVTGQCLPRICWLLMGPNLPADTGGSHLLRWGLVSHFIAPRLTSGRPGRYPVPRKQVPEV